jgi:hypothetical protein
MAKTMLSGQLSTFRSVSSEFVIKPLCIAKTDIIDLVNCYKIRTFDEEITRLEELGGTSLFSTHGLFL